MKAVDYWNERYSSGGNSGDGSYGDTLVSKLQLLKNLPIKSITEVGCGDFNFGSHLMEMYPDAKYWGYDISDIIVTQNKKKYPQYTFSSGGIIPKADLVLCVDVLFHILDDAEYESTLKELEALWTDYLVITAYEEVRATSPHLKIRVFDYSRFGKPIVRQVVKESEQLYMYIFKKPQIRLSEVTAVLNTKEDIYPPEVLASVVKYPFGEILVKTHSDSPYAKYELFNKAKYDLIYYQDDDAICSIEELAEQSKPDMINLVMASEHFEIYDRQRMSMGFPWGSIFPKSVLKNLERYTKVYGEDEIFKRDTEKILTELVYPQNRLFLPIHSLPSALNPDRLSFQPEHYSNMEIIIERCAKL